ncbi:MAG: hypothetical protein E7370_03850 [Clostridiales bacterium]|nr:hypothetical protein [Clostridiales bacterium]
MLCFFVGCVEKADHYTVDEHIERVSALVEKRYMTENSEYTDYSVYPIYDENNELRYMLIEFKPYGFVYVKINEEKLHFPYAVSMYVRDTSEGKTWRRYTIEENGNKTWEVNENGEYINYNSSHFKVANIQDEKRYLLKVENNFIPAVKREEKFLNLVSMQEMDYEPTMKASEQAVSEINFISKNYFDL